MDPPGPASQRSWTAHPKNYSQAIPAVEGSSVLKPKSLSNRTRTFLVLTEKQSNRQEDEAGGVQQRRHAEPKVRPPNSQVSALILNSRVSLFLGEEEEEEPAVRRLVTEFSSCSCSAVLRSESIHCCCSSAERRRRRKRRRKIYSRVPDQLRALRPSGFLQDKC
ncbi:hypothetical protein CRENBAI_006780 [Crenichthys baileyi]|uniref:Uncharacterized protein n=1 Tax=Crenichthys baileyi TaxID=28760 RepID=A0AAV9SEI8_9TELE